ncbi:MAG: TetR/AcrR family transcriptional regulator [bacterium]|nr:TetR/AcrR family transcriptional regulator [bacterium]MDW8105163.1 TetR/AcrR family transcriptional regulator [Armatimonadota bacterium]
MSSPSLSREQQAQLRRQQLIDAALQQFGQKGYDGASIRSIARAAGVTEALVYHYFRNKEHLFEEVLKARSFAPILRRVLDEASDLHPAQVVQRALQEFLDMMRDNAVMARMFIIEFTRHPVCARYFRAMAEDNTANLARYLQEQQRRGIIRPEVDTEIVAGMLLGMAFALFFTWGQAPDREWQQRRERLLHQGIPIVLRGLWANPEELEVVEQSLNKMPPAS